ncbi:host-nuclease inhibitor Gam family protein [Thermoanaerobacterium thermosaccharolyticum]|uniref:host-nuclease inhibitor Gam family protein n=1 Tax=Thermoanaerobacterium thermosaccharolyticum TaxID=1517 RepID=UPI003DA83627
MMEDFAELEKEFLDATEKQIASDKGIHDDAYADWTINKIKTLQAELERKKMFVENKKAMLDEWYEQQAKSINNDITFYTSRLQQYFDNLDPKVLNKGKTQLSYSLPSGKLVKKLEKPEFKRDDETLLPWIEKNAPQYIKIKKDIDWAELKKKLSVDKNKIILTDTGEVVEGIAIENKPAEFEVK